MRRSSPPGRGCVVIGRAGVGVDNVDLDAATRAGIVVVNAPTGNTIAAAEHTLALLYARRPAGRRGRRVDPARRVEARGQFTGVELRGRTLGIVGLGKIGQAIADRARAMEMTVLGGRPVRVRGAGGPPRGRAGRARRPPRAVRRDHPPRPAQPADPRAHRARELARMKPGAILLNVARGGIVDEAALAEALRRATSAAPGSTCSSTSRRPDSPLLDAPNTVLTPHLGASTAEAQVLVAEEVAAQILDVLAGRPARYAVNAPLLTPETARAIAPYLPLAEMLGRFFAQFCRTRGHDAHPRGRRRAGRVRRRAAHGGGPARPPRDGDDRAGQPRQRRRAGQGARDHGRRAQDARGRPVRLAAHAVGRGRAGDDDGRRHGGRRRAAARPAGRLLARHGPDRDDARDPPPRPARDDRAGSGSCSARRT